MPDPTPASADDTSITDPSAMPNTASEAPRPTLIGVEIRRQPGRPPSLVLDCTAFHAHLERIGVLPNGADEYEHLPGRRAYIANGRVLPFALLSGRTRQPLTISLADAYNGAATFQQLMDLAYSVDTVAKEVVEHYRPVEITLRLVDKK